MKSYRDDTSTAIETDFVDLEGKRILVAFVPPTAADQRPVYVTSKGVTNGAYLRTGDGDRRMSEVEIALVCAARTQPTYDHEPVLKARFEDFDRNSVARTLERVRQGSAYLREVDDATALHRLGALSGPDPDAPPTLAGLLTFGRFPQQFFQRLMASVVVHPSDGDVSDTRFLDNVTLRGPIPEIVTEALAVLRRNLSARAVIVEGSREDRLDFPLPAMREAVVNALMHRDYSPTTRGTQVQIDLWPDRLVIRSPGGLYGPISEEDLGEAEVSSSRNSVLAQLLSDVYLPRSDNLVAENRASGIPIMISQARWHGLPRPVFESRVTSFTVTMARSELLGPEAAPGPAKQGVSDPVDLVTAIREARTATVADLQVRTGLSRSAVLNNVNELVASGQVRAHGAPQSPKRTYEWIGDAQ
ncbi:MAG: hypothetical protein M3Z25_15165 [Actinomycetota bacterium]|nr:hypothetical protein [Actinomycetota bacterium]